MSHARYSEAADGAPCRFNYTSPSGARRQAATSICRFTVSSDVSPVGPDLVGTSVAVGERVSPQRSPLEGAVRASRIASSVFRCRRGAWLPPIRRYVLRSGLYSPRSALGTSSLVHLKQRHHLRKVGRALVIGRVWCMGGGWGPKADADPCPSSLTSGVAQRRSERESRASTPIDCVRGPRSKKTIRYS